MTNNKKNSLIMCTTPLQMMIAENIIKANSNQNFDLIVITKNDNIKYRYYYKRLANLCNNTLYYLRTSGFVDFVKFITRFELSKLDKKYDNYYLSSIDSKHFQYIFSKNYKSSNLYTFDDGSANINKSSTFYKYTSLNTFKSFVWKRIGVKLTKEEILRLSKLHYSIYDNIPNIIENVQYLKLYDEDEPTVIMDKRNSIRIFLGAPMLEVSTDFTNDYIKNIANHLKVDYYYPHPREVNIPIGNYQIIDSSLIFEDYIINYLKNNPTVEIEVFSFLSTACLNISNLKRIKVNYLYTPYLLENYSTLYIFAKNSFNITLTEINSPKI